MKCIYKFSTKSRSERLYRELYGSESRNYKSCSLETKFKFKCIGSGSCCRDRRGSHNIICGRQSVCEIKDYCHKNKLKINGRVTNEKLYLDGSEAFCAKNTVARVPVTGKKGLAFVGAGSCECQFYEASKCSIYEVRPVLCKILPVVVVLEHLGGEGRVHLAFDKSLKAKCPDCHDGEEITVSEWLKEQVGEVEFNNFISGDKNA
jgi:Fe-S-cluster containining protein